MFHESIQGAKDSRMDQVKFVEDSFLFGPFFYALSYRVLSKKTLGHLKFFMIKHLQPFNIDDVRQTIQKCIALISYLSKTKQKGSF